MKKAVCLLAFLSSLAPLFAQSTAGLERWITDYPKGGNSFAGFRITRCTIERTGALLVIDRRGLPVRLNLLKPTALEPLVERFRQVERTLLEPGELSTASWNVVPSGCEIDFGLKDEMSVVLKIESFRVSLNKETVVDLTGRLDGPPEFRRQPSGAGFTYRLRFTGIDLGTGNGDVFPGWTEYLKRLAAWFVKGLDANDQEVLALVLERKVMSLVDRQTQKRIVLSRDKRSNLWFGLNLDYFLPSLVEGYSNGVALDPFGRHYFQPMLYLSWRDLGEPAWLAKPFWVTVGLGGFVEWNAGYAARAATGEFLLRPNGPGSFIVAGGPSVSVEFTAMTPLIVDNKYTGDLFGVGFELVAAFNVPYFLPEYAYDWFLNALVNVVIHFIPVDGFGLNGVIGFRFTFVTGGYDERNGGFFLGQYGINLGVRAKFDFYNFYEPTPMLDIKR